MQKSHGLSRRDILTTAPLVPLASIGRAAQPSFSTAQLRLIEAFVDRLIPTDENGPGARECGVAVYFDRSFATALAEEKPAFVKSLAAVDAFSRATQDAPLADLTPARQDAVLTALEDNSASGFTPDSRTFFYRMRQLTFEGMFGDPAYGGNRNYAGWDLLRYPGPRMAVSAEDQRLREPIKKLRTSGAAHGH
ncbi:MAG: gluconate 2-dehydrogenase subunit 3 family protein [Bryobacteraceae bacterium]